MSKTDTKKTTNDGVTAEDLANVERGDIITIDGIEYPVYRLNSGLRSLFRPDYPDVVTPDGEIKSLAYGALPSNPDGPTALCWIKNTPDSDDNDEFSGADCLTVGLSDVSIRSGELPLTELSNRLLSTDTRGCPECGNDSITFDFGSRDGCRYIEIGKCTDCKTHVAIDREIPDTTATVQARSHKGDWGETVELSGIYREVVSSRFKMDPRKQAKEEFYSAKEVAHFIEAKMNDDGEAQQFGYTTVNTGVHGDSVTWRDDRMDQKLEIRFRPVR